MPEPSPIDLPAELRSRFLDPVLLGSGAFGRVLRARRAEDRTPVAIKLLDPSLAEQQEVRRRFTREAAAGARIDSPHVVRVLEAGADPTPYLVMEFVDGPDLAEVLRLGGGHLPRARADALLDDMLAGLEAIHAAGFLHRDLKPSNVLVGRDGRARLTDLGLVRIEDGEILTRTGTILGTPAYMSPEQMQAEEPAPTWDLYALAVVYVEMLTGRPPFDAENLGRLLAGKRAGPDPQLAKQLPADLRQTLPGWLAPDPARRPPDVVALRRDWEACRRTETRDSPAVPLASDTLQVDSGGATQRVDAGWVASITGKTSGRQGAAFPAPGTIPAEQACLPPSPPCPPAAACPVAPSQASVRVGPALAASAGALLLGLAWWGSGRPAAPAPSPEPPSAKLSAAARATLTRLRESVVRSPALAEAVRELRGPVKPAGARELWKSAVQDIEAAFREDGVAAMAEELSRVPLDRLAAADLGAVLLRWRLLSTTVEAGSFQYLYSAAARRLEQAYAQSVQVVPLPELSGWPPAGRDFEAWWTERHAVLEELGGTWVLLRGRDPERLPDPRNAWTHYQGESHEFRSGRIRKTTLDGIPFPAPDADAGSTLVASIYRSESQNRRYHLQETQDVAEVEILLRRPDTPALDLAAVTYNTDPTAQLVLALEGETTLELPVQIADSELPTPSDDRSLDDKPRRGFYLRVAGSLVPRDLRRIRIRVHGVQSLGTIDYTINLVHVFLRTGGAEPRALADPTR